MQSFTSQLKNELLLIDKKNDDFLSDSEYARELFSKNAKNADSINLDGIKNPAVFLRSAFIETGVFANPNKSYRIEYILTSERLAIDLQKMLSDLNYEFKRTARREMQVLYMKNSSNIEDFLTYIGASKYTMELINIKIYKDLRNKVNRLSNCEVANIGKTAKAYSLQLAAIEKIRNSPLGFAQLSDDLRKTAELRIRNPDMTLSELGQLFEPKLSRSGVNHRLRSLVRIASALPSGQSVRN